MMSWTRIRGLSEPIGSWKTICSSRRSSMSWLSRAPATSFPATRTLPALGWSSPARIRSNVDLPDPDSPTTPKRCPALNVEGDATQRPDLAGLLEQGRPSALVIADQVLHADDRLRSSLRARRHGRAGLGPVPCPPRSRPSGPRGSCARRLRSRRGGTPRPQARRAAALSRSTVGGTVAQDFPDVWAERRPRRRRP